MVLPQSKQSQTGLSAPVHHRQDIEWALNWSESYVFLNANWHLLYDGEHFSSRLLLYRSVRTICRYGVFTQRGWADGEPDVSMAASDVMENPPHLSLLQPSFSLVMTMKHSWLCEQLGRGSSLQNAARFISYSYILFYSTWFNTICCQLLFVWGHWVLCSMFADAEWWMSPWIRTVAEQPRPPAEKLCIVQIAMAH